MALTPEQQSEVERKLREIYDAEIANNSYSQPEEIQPSDFVKNIVINRNEPKNVYTDVLPATQELHQQTTKDMPRVSNIPTVSLFGDQGTATPQEADIARREYLKKQSAIMNSIKPQSKVLPSDVVERQPLETDLNATEAYKASELSKELSGKNVFYTPEEKDETLKRITDAQLNIPVKLTPNERQRISDDYSKIFDKVSKTPLVSELQIHQDTTQPIISEETPEEANDKEFLAQESLDAKPLETADEISTMEKRLFDAQRSTQELSDKYDVKKQQDEEFINNLGQTGAELGIRLAGAISDTLRRDFTGKSQSQINAAIQAVVNNELANAKNEANKQKIQYDYDIKNTKNKLEAEKNATLAEYKQQEIELKFENNQIKMDQLLQKEDQINKDIELKTNQLSQKTLNDDERRQIEWDRNRLMEERNKLLADKKDKEKEHDELIDKERRLRIANAEENLDTKKQMTQGSTGEYFTFAPNAALKRDPTTIRNAAQAEGDSLDSIGLGDQLFTFLAEKDKNNTPNVNKITSELKRINGNIWGFTKLMDTVGLTKAEDYIKKEIEKSTVPEVKQYLAKITPVLAKMRREVAGVGAPSDYDSKLLMAIGSSFDPYALMSNMKEVLGMGYSGFKNDQSKFQRVPTNKFAEKESQYLKTWEDYNKSVKGQSTTTKPTNNKTTSTFKKDE